MLADNYEATTVFTSEDTGIVRKGSVVAGVSVSVKEAESHSFTSQMTDIPLESGAVVSDHVILQPEQLSVSIAMTNTSENGDNFSAFDQFYEMLNSREPVEVITEHWIYTNMVLISFTPNHTAPFRQAYTAECVFKKANMVTLNVVGKSPTKLKGGAKKTGSGTVNAGTVESGNASDADKSQAAVWYDTIKKG